MTQSSPVETAVPLSPVPLNLTTKLAYGVGEMSSEVTGSILVFFALCLVGWASGLSVQLAFTFCPLPFALWDGPLACLFN